jgi:iron(III) transport system ATP-binding protein
MNILEIKNLNKTYEGNQNFALSEFNFNLEKGKICAVVGESGCVKTTLFRLIAGLENPDSGEIKIANQVVSNLLKIVVPQKRNVGMVFQDFALFPHLTVAQNIGFSLKSNEVGKIKDVLKTMKLESFDHRFPNELSTGQQQRVALARTLVTNPQLLLLDEPFSNLDALLKDSLRKELIAMIKPLGISVLFITHDLEDALAIADEVVIVKDGKLLESGSIAAVSQHAKNEYVKSIFSNLKSSAERIIHKLKD